MGFELTNSLNQKLEAFKVQEIQLLQEVRTLLEVCLLRGCLLAHYFCGNDFLRQLCLLAIMSHVPHMQPPAIETGAGMGRSHSDQ